MARYKHIDTSPRFLAVDLERQLLPGTFEHALNHLLDHPIDLSCFDTRFCNDLTGAATYPPAMLLKVVLFAYSQAVVSSRGIERACREHVIFVALCGDSSPHFTTIANFVSTLGEDIARVFAAVLAICDRQGLIGREMFTIDGVKLPSNASKSRGGTRSEFERQATKLEAAAKTMLQRHREEDAKPLEPDLAVKEGHTVNLDKPFRRPTEPYESVIQGVGTNTRGFSGGRAQSSRTGAFQPVAASRIWPQKTTGATRVPPFAVCFGSAVEAPLKRRVQGGRRPGTSLPAIRFFDSLIVCSWPETVCYRRPRPGMSTGAWILCTISWQTAGRFECSR